MIVPKSHDEVESVESQPRTERAAPPPRGDGRRHRFWWLALLAIVVVSTAAAGLRIARDFIGDRGYRANSPEAAPDGPPAWDGYVTIDAAAQAAIGLNTALVENQTKPIRLELLGRTKYDEETLTKIRMMFKGRADDVHVRVGQDVAAGEPLIDVYSTELAEAKMDYEVQKIQWTYERTLLETREALKRKNAIPEQLYLESLNSEMKNRREYDVARDKLLLYGLNQEEIAKVEHEVGPDKAKMTLRSPASGIVIERNVVTGNLYDADDTLLIIAPLDHLWVWGNVFESDLDLVALGQRWEIEFPFLRDKIYGKVEYMSNNVDPGTHAVRIRTSIPNPQQRLKSDMLVRGVLEIPPVAGRTVVPRSAVIVSDGHFYVFTRVRGQRDKFVRRSVEMAHEKDDHAVISYGLSPGEEAVTVGGLILGQMYENLLTRYTGVPSTHGPGVD